MIEAHPISPNDGLGSPVEPEFGNAHPLDVLDVARILAHRWRHPQWAQVTAPRHLTIAMTHARFRVCLRQQHNDGPRQLPAPGRILRPPLPRRQSRHLRRAIWNPRTNRLQPRNLVGPHREAEQGPSAWPLLRRQPRLACAKPPPTSASTTSPTSADARRDKSMRS